MDGAKRTRIKVCGITSSRDAEKAVSAGADAIGLVFYPDSPRGLTAEEAATICAELPPLVSAVGVFVDPSAEAVTDVLAHCPLDVLQFHGAQTPAFCSGFGRRYLRAVRMGPETELAPLVVAHGPHRLLLDAHVPGQPGGTGRTFAWGAIPGELAGRFVLAGGLTPQNVAEAVRAARPFAVDVSSGVEDRPGEKSADRIAAFMEGVRDGDDG